MLYVRRATTDLKVGGFRVNKGFGLNELRRSSIDRHSQKRLIRPVRRYEKVGIA